MKDNFKRIKLMKCRGIKLIATLLAVALVFTMTQSVVNAETLGSAVSSLVPSQSNDAGQKASAQIGSGEILQPEKTEVRVEDTANDATPTIMQGWDKTHMRKDDRVYIGKWGVYPISWSVVNPKGANITYEQGTGKKDDVYLKNIYKQGVEEDNAAFLIASDPLAQQSIIFAGNDSMRPFYQDSWVRQFLSCSWFQDSFSRNELCSILKTTKTDSAYRITGAERYVGGTLEEDKFFLPSVSEIDTYDCGIKNGDYWLRSILDNYHWPHGACAAVMNDKNQHTYANEYDQRLVRPAMNLDCTRVVLTSALTGKPIKVSSEMMKVGENTGREYKLTLQDDNRMNFAVVNTNVSGCLGENVSFTYYNAKTGANEYISAIITEKDNPNRVLYYGKLGLALEGYNTVNMKIPMDLKNSVYTLKIFNEQCTNNSLTDYSSPLKDATLFVNQIKVTYDKGDATGGDTPQDLNAYKPGDEVTVLGQGNLVKRVGETFYTFAGWTDGTNIYKAGDKFTTSKSNITLKAQWKECKTIMMGAELQYGNYVYMGRYNNNPIKWRVNNADGANITYKQDGAIPEDLVLKDDSGNNISVNKAVFLITDDVMQGVIKTFGNGQKYAGSSIRNWLNSEFLSAFNSKQLGAILKTTKTDEPYTIKETFTYANQDGTPMNNILGNDKVFLPSVKEVVSYFNDTSRSSSDWWWLRSPIAAAANLSAVVKPDGEFSLGDSLVDNGVRPAINFNQDTVIFTSALDGGKSVGVGPTMSLISAVTTPNYKFTLKDSSKDSFLVSTTGVSGRAGETVSFNYADATQGTDEYISAIIIKNDGSNDIICYGKLANSSGSGTADMVIPENLDSGTYTVKIFNEQQDNYGNVDYASVLRDVTLTVNNTSEVSPEFSSES